MVTKIEEAQAHDALGAEVKAVGDDHGGDADEGVVGEKTDRRVKGIHLEKIYNQVRGNKTLNKYGQLFLQNKRKLIFPNFINSY